MKNKNKNKKDYVARLTIEEMPRTKKGEDDLVAWLRSIASEIKREDPDIFATPCRFTLFKLNPHPNPPTK